MKSNDSEPKACSAFDRNLPLRCARAMLHSLSPRVRKIMICPLPLVVLQVVQGEAAGDLVQALQAHARDAPYMQHLHIMRFQVLSKY